MIPRKKRITIIAIVTALAVLLIAGILIFLYLKTDAFKSNETLFAKYLIQNFDTIELLGNDDNSEVETMLSNNKYTSETEGKIEYTENKGTSGESKNSSVNDVKINVNGNIDNANDYKYYDIAISNKNEKLVGLEYLKQDETYGIRLNGIQQFVSTQNQNEEKNKMKSIDQIMEELDIDSIIKLSEEEKQTLSNTYIGIIQKNVPKNKYHKQSNSLITINNKDVQSTAYYISFTVEEFNNLYIKMLEQLSNDEIILSKIDKITEKMKEIDKNYNKNLREEFVQNINDKIKEIQDNNIGNEEVKITVYQSKMKTVRTSIEEGTQKTIIDFYDDTSMKITNTEIKDTTKEDSIKIEKKDNGTQKSIFIEYENTENNTVQLNTYLDYEQNVQDNEIQTNIKFSMSNEKNDAILSITNKKNIVQKFENQITLENDNVDLDKLSDEQLSKINEILSENAQTQLSNLLAVVNLNDYIKILQNLGIVNENTIQLPNEGEITETERKRFNSQFEFFVSEHLTTDNIKELLNTTENNFEDMKVLLRTGEVQDLDMDKLNNSRESTEYKESIAEILFYIKRNSNNDDKVEETQKYLEKYSSDKYTVSINYDNDGLTRIIRAKIEEN